MLAVFVIELILPGNFSWLGIRPRRISGLIGIATSPFLHADFRHLFANAMPLLILGSLVSALQPSLFVSRTVALIAISGLLTWLISSSGVVIGASGLVFAYWSYLMTNGFLQRRVKDIIVAVVTFFVYGALIFGLFRVEYGVSWAGHFSGAVAGVVLAFIQKRGAKSLP